MVDNSWIAHLLYSERSSLPPTAAFPSFHVLWAVFVGRLWPRWLWMLYVATIAISCVTTGMHYIPDIFAALVISPLLLEPGRRIWKPLLRLTDRITNVRPPIRISIAAFVLVAVMSAAVGTGREYEALVAASGGLIGVYVGRRALNDNSLRSLEFYVGIAGVALASAWFEDRWILWGAFSLAAPWMKVVSRSPLPFIVGDAFLGLVVMHLWTSGSPLSLICGVYMIGLGFIRFVQDARFRLGQWFAAGTVLVGMALTSFSATGAPALAFSPAVLWPALLFTIAAAGLGGRFGPRKS